MKKARILITPYDLERKTANISLPVLVPKIGNNLGSKDLDILKVTLSPQNLMIKWFVPALIKRSNISITSSGLPTPIALRATLSGIFRAALHLLH